MGGREGERAGAASFRTDCERERIRILCGLNALGPWPRGKNERWFSYDVKQGFRPLPGPNREHPVGECRKILQFPPGPMIFLKCLKKNKHFRCKSPNCESRRRICAVKIGKVSDFITVAQRPAFAGKPLIINHLSSISGQDSDDELSVDFTVCRQRCGVKTVKSLDRRHFLNSA